jgi:drug/metabolite transporter (DMT)-like permease
MLARPILSDVNDASKRPALGAFYALLGALLFGINGSVAKVVMAAGITAPQLTFLRGLSAALIAGVILMITAREQFRISARDAWGLAALGVGGLAMIQWLYAVAISRLPVGVALLIQYTAVIIVALAAWLIFKERVHARLWVAIAAVLAGLAVVARVWDSHLDALGVITAIAAAFAYAFYFLAGERGVARRPALAVAFWASLFATAFWALFSGWWNLDLALLAQPTSLTGTLSEFSPPLWAPLLWVLTLGAFAPFVLSFSALRHLSATAVGILASSEVLFAFLVAWVWLGEAMAAIEIAGAAVVLAGILIAQTARERPKASDTDVAEVAEVPTEVP